ncbi:hypothetical protein K501DRAFT_275811 [Backusella circina FSU 941]|nr:hypothetical protein K501DRAFT_275811 [Backusella circina FSU 941]
MSMTAASRKVKMSSSTGKMYYAIYKNDPEKKTPLPINQSGMFKSECTQEQIATLIKCKTDNNMSLTFASVKANMHPLTGINYHLQYMSNPDRKIPAPNNNTRKYGRRCTKDQVKALIGYIINDSMKIHAAAIKTGMSKATAKRYYAKYLNDPNHNIPDPKGKANGATVACTKKRIKELIDYIIHGKMSLLAASIKTNICESTARKYYLKYLNDPNHEIPSSSVKSRCIGGIACTQEQVKGLIDYIVNEKMSIQAAAVKANMSEPTARKYYLEYLNDPNRDIPIPKRKMQDKIKQLIGYIVNDKMSICAASKEVNISYPIALKYYHQYLHDLDYKIPDPNEKINNIKQKHLPTKK